MRLAKFILANVKPILSEWEAFAGSLESGAKMTKLALRDDAEAILPATARDMQVDQSLAQQASKSKGHGGARSAESDRLDNASVRHGGERVGSGFDIMEVVSEYRALRASVLRLWRKSVSQPDLDDIDSITRFNESMPLTRGPVDMEKLCREVFEGFRLTNPHRTLRFHLDGDLTGDWDAARLRQVVSNLMNNALQHGSPEGPIELSLVASEESSVVLSVRNEGAPIPPDMLATIFDPLVRHATAESAARRVPGSIGLGLYIVREIVVAHGGTIEVASTAQEGTTFTVRLPRQPPVEGDQRSDDTPEFNAADVDFLRRESMSFPGDVTGRCVDG